MEERGNLASPRKFNRGLPVQFNSKFSVDKAHAAQRSLAKRVTGEDNLPTKIHFVAGTDVAYAGKVSIGVATVLSYESLDLVESQVAHVETRFPYIPTLLSFRELPPTLAAIRKLKNPSDVFLVDGHGIAHPYRLGFASHLGLVIGKPTIGVAKSILCGKVGRIARERRADLTDKGAVIGAAVETETGRKPLYVSIGHQISLKRAIEIVKHCTRNHRIPRPILAAHKLANDEKRKHLKRL